MLEEKDEAERFPALSEKICHLLECKSAPP